MKVCRVEVIGKQSIVQAAKHGGSKSSLSKRMLNKKNVANGIIGAVIYMGPSRQASCNGNTSFDRKWLSHPWP